MPKSDSFWDHPVKTIEEALAIRKQIDALQTRLSSMFGGVATLAPVRRKRRTGTMSAAARERIAAAQRARWAKLKGKGAAKSTAPATKPARKTRKKGNLTPEGRAKLAASMKARWAAKRKAAAESAKA